ncbi:MAG: HAD family hydrolase, partial [Mariprofundaceae bacterium]
ERPQAVTFDAVGTFLHFAEPVAVTYTRFAHQFGVEATELTMRRRFPMAFQAAPSLVPQAGAVVAEFERDWWRNLVARVYGCALDDANFSACFDALFTWFASPEAWRIHDDFAPMLLQLREMDVQLGVISNFDGRLHAILDALLPGVFSLVVLPGNSGFQKPQAGIFTFAAAQMDVAPKHVLHLGDQENEDVNAAQGTGMHALRWSFPLDNPTRAKERLLGYWGLVN